MLCDFFSEEIVRKPFLMHSYTSCSHSKKKKKKKQTLPTHKPKTTSSFKLQRTNTKDTATFPFQKSILWHIYFPIPLVLIVEGDLSREEYKLIVKSRVANRTRQDVLCKHTKHSFSFILLYIYRYISSGIISNPLLRFARLSKNVFIFYANKSRDNNKVEIFRRV